MENVCLKILFILFYVYSLSLFLHATIKREKKKREFKKERKKAKKKPFFIIFIGSAALFPLLLPRLPSPHYNKLYNISYG